MSLPLEKHKDTLRGRLKSLGNVTSPKSARSLACVFPASRPDSAAPATSLRGLRFRCGRSAPAAAALDFAGGKTLYNCNDGIHVLSDTRSIPLCKMDNLSASCSRQKCTNSKGYDVNCQSHGAQWRTAGTRGESRRHFSKEDSPNACSFRLHAFYAGLMRGHCRASCAAAIGSQPMRSVAINCGRRSNATK